VREAVQDQGMNARIAGQHLPERAGRRVAVEDRTDILTEMPEHGSTNPLSMTGRILEYSTEFVSYFRANGKAKRPVSDRPSWHEAKRDGYLPSP
jgi:hypothetical protein